MRHFLIALLFLSLFACDDFAETNRFFTTDKTEYTSGDTIKLTVNITTDKEKKLRFYKSLKNIEISSSLNITDTINSEMFKTYTANGIKEENALREENEIETYFVSNKKPFVKTIKGVISESKDNFEINFYEYGLILTIDKAKYFKANSFGFTGLCMPINGSFGESYEDYINYHPIKLKTKL
ncbi:hypothetical protein [Flavobacterium aurantiibacter]|uniref:Lipoprotein n=1 Tax=Flavobacterium aurantiibacter TaxID=2023067 RepID=A0A256A8X2_9FLAO|nr:hypothetical protein [Flavobacterium aurantiibacter]OYQ50039.1 hypothetical protein CHX27_01025 [Flavobacterium aurantiibacter]